MVLIRHSPPLGIPCSGIHSDDNYHTSLINLLNMFFDSLRQFVFIKKNTLVNHCETTIFITQPIHQ